MGVRLDCPLCGGVVADGTEPRAGRCPTCGARIEGGAPTPIEAAALALEALGASGRSAEDVASALFAVGPGHPLDGRIAITSDRRDAFYLWWIALGADCDVEAVLDRLATGG